MLPRSQLSRWILCPRPNPEASSRLFCLPYAGGSASIFKAWPGSLPHEIEVCFIQLPGRENRFTELPFTRMEPLVQSLAQDMFPYLDKPFAFFGHSMGALISFELARYLRKKGGINPAHLFVSAHRAPHLPDRRKPVYSLPHPEFLRVLRDLNGTPESVLQNEELMQLILPTLRADFALAETYQYTASDPLSCPITAFGGLQDKTVNKADLVAWQQQTSNTCAIHMFNGNHFFIHSESVHLLPIIADILARIYV